MLAISRETYAGLRGVYAGWGSEKKVQDIPTESQQSLHFGCVEKVEDDCESKPEGWGSSGRAGEYRGLRPICRHAERIVLRPS